MTKGIAQRRRLKRALEAARGNLHKIANGKALPTALPEAPKPKDAEKLPASLRKMLALKEVAAKRDSKGRKTGEIAAPSDAQGGKRGKAASSQRARKGDEARAQGADDGPSTSGRCEVAAGKAEQQRHKDGKDSSGGGGGAAAVRGASVFAEQFVQKKLKERKKEYLKRKQQERKRGKGAGGVGPGGQMVVEKELELRDQVKFGEVVHAPLQVHLKRKHWADKEKTASERCKEVFLKQMQQAQQRMAAEVGAGGDGAMHEGTGVGRTAKGGAKGSSGGGGKGGAEGGQKNLKRKAPMDEQTEELRQRVIESYRATKKGGGLHGASVGQATLASLSHLVCQSGAATAAGSAGPKGSSAGGGRTRTPA